MHFTATETRLRRLLLSGAEHEEWEANFGAAGHAQLRALARLAGRGQRRGRPRVYLLPGIMGSKLAYRPRGARADRLLWIEPEEIQRHGLEALALPKGKRCHPSGVMVLNYLKLKLTLEVAGFDVVFHPYDWRQGVDTLARELNSRLAGDRARSVMLVAHSMGGLIARAALGLARGQSKVARLVMLGVPNSGSFAPLMALRGVYPAVRRVATLDLLHSAEALTREVFSTFAGLYHMLPAGTRLDFCDPRNWPQDTLTPRRSLLRGVPKLRRSLAAADERFAVIAGVNQDTVTDAVLVDDAYEYAVTRNGDGTVPLEFALLRNAPAWYVEENHAALPVNDAVCGAVDDLLRAGVTGRLKQTWQPVAGTRTVTEAALRQLDVQKYDWRKLTLEERRRLLQGLVLPMPAKPAPVT